MCPEPPGGDDPENERPGERFAYFRGSLGFKTAFEIGREQGFGEGVAAMHRAIVKVLRARRQNGGLRRPPE